MSDQLDQSTAFAALPPLWAHDELPSIRAALAENPRKVWILDDDPTGTQTIAGLPVVTRWDVPTLQAEFANEHAGCFVLTNSRGLTAERSRSLHRQLIKNLTQAAQDRPFTVISRSDSTLRGHYPLETDVVAEGPGESDLTLIAPFFAAGGRYTLNDTHYVAEGNQLVPAAKTPFARDAVFGYSHSHLPTWVEEKTAGRTSAQDVVCLSLDLIRNGGPEAVSQQLIAAPQSGVVITNATDQSDIEVVAHATLLAEQAGRSIIARTAASFVCARVGQRPPPLLRGDEMVDSSSTTHGGLTVVGSYVPKTTAQLTQLKKQLKLVSIELEVSDLLDRETRGEIIANAITKMNNALSGGEDVVVHTSRELVRSSDEVANLSIGSEVSRALVEIVQGIAVRPRYLIAKGGITSSDTATEGLGVKRAMVAGQILPGVPVWRLGSETKFPGLSYVVFPGNVGDDHAVADAVRKLNNTSS
ncbi:MAG: four-carbon acid sugar kinase family protein [Synoicihabitans sp.]